MEIGPALHTERGFDRLVNFSDAVVAIAITLLVLPITDVASKITERTSPAELWQEDSGTFWAFVISFVVLANYWLIHHRMFEAIDAYDGALTWLNIGWLFSIVLLPFSTELIAQVSFANGWGLIYTLNLAAISAFLTLIGWHVKRHPELQTPGVSLSQLRMLKSVVYCVFFVVIGLFSLWQPLWASYSMLLLLPLGIWLGRWDRGDDSVTGTADQASA